MYYVNREQIELRLGFIPSVTNVLRKLKEEWRDEDPVLLYALERAVHLAAECVTDVGSYVIDGFLMRDASSYEDIINVLHGENAVSDSVHRRLTQLVGERKPLVQRYYEPGMERLVPFLDWLPETLEAFAAETLRFIENESG